MKSLTSFLLDLMQMIVPRELQCSRTELFRTDKEDLQYIAMNVLIPDGSRGLVWLGAGLSGKECSEVPVQVPHDVESSQITKLATHYFTKLSLDLFLQPSFDSLLDLTANLSISSII